jgi:hypothetical protein
MHLGCYQEFLLDNLRRRRPFSFKGELEKADELFPKEQGEGLMGEDLADALIMEAGDMVEGAIWGCASLCCQDMDVGMEIDAISESLDHRHHSWHELMACDGVKIFQEGMDGCKR